MNVFNAASVLKFIKIPADITFSSHAASAKLPILENTLARLAFFLISRNIRIPANP